MDELILRMFKKFGSDALGDKLVKTEDDPLEEVGNLLLRTNKITFTGIAIVKNARSRVLKRDDSKANRTATLRNKGRIGVTRLFGMSRWVDTEEVVQTKTFWAENSGVS